MGRKFSLSRLIITSEVYRKYNGKWSFSHSIDGFWNPVRQFEVYHSGNIWAAHMSLGIYRIELSRDLKKVEKCTYIKSLSTRRE